MKKILVFGAGLSAYFAIKYLAGRAQAKHWEIVVADSSQENLDACKIEFPEIKFIKIDVFDAESRTTLISSCQVVVSLLPNYFHITVAKDCVEFGAHLVTPSYTSAEMNKLNEAAVSKKITILNEIGLDPGLDHLSSMNIIDRLKKEGSEMTSYSSFCGGLLSKESCDNPWDYKFTWNPYSVVRAGADGALCLVDGHFKYVPYHRLFKEAQTVKVAGESFEMYLNRDSTRYISLYGLEGVPTFLRGTLRYPGFCNKWAALINAGLTADKIEITLPDEYKWKQYLKAFHFDSALDTETKQALDWLFEDADLLELKTATPAANLQKLLESKWEMKPNDKDRVIMLHEFGYEKDGKQYVLKSLMDLEGEDNRETAMAKTVGLPLAIAAGLLADGIIKTFGVILPVIPEVYKPLLEALGSEGIRFQEELSVI